MRAWVVFALVLALLESASAQPHERAALAALDLATDAPPYLRARATTQIEQGLAATGYDVLPTVRLPDNLAHCRSSDCMRDVGRVLGVQAIVVASITPRGDSSVIALRLFDGTTGRQLAELSEVCDLCGESELIEHLGIATSAVRARAADALPVAGVREAPVIESSSIAPGIVVGTAGVAAIATGIYLVVLDGRGACSAGDTPVYPDPNAVIRYPDPANHDVFVCRDIYKTRPLGIVGIGVGAAAVVLGAVLVVRARDRTFEVAPTATGATVRMSVAW
jgi:hypothetical protein